MLWVCHEQEQLGGLGAVESRAEFKQFVFKKASRESAFEFLSRKTFFAFLSFPHPEEDL